MAIALCVSFAGRWAAPQLLGVLSDVQRWGLIAPLVFVSLYAISVVALVPASLLTVVGGALFGLVRGVAYSMCGAVVGSTAAFWLGRHVARRIVERRLASM